MAATYFCCLVYMYVCVFFNSLFRWFAALFFFINSKKDLIGEFTSIFWHFHILCECISVFRCCYYISLFRFILTQNRMTQSNISRMIFLVYRNVVSGCLLVNTVALLVNTHNRTVDETKYICWSTYCFIHKCC